METTAAAATATATAITIGAFDPGVTNLSFSKIRVDPRDPRNHPDVLKEVMPVFTLEMTTNFDMYKKFPAIKKAYGSNVNNIPRYITAMVAGKLIEEHKDLLLGCDYIVVEQQLADGSYGFADENTGNPAVVAVEMALYATLSVIGCSVKKVLCRSSKSKFSMFPHGFRGVAYPFDQPKPNYTQRKKNAEAIISAALATPGNEDNYSVFQAGQKGSTGTKGKIADMCDSLGLALVYFMEMQGVKKPAAAAKRKRAELLESDPLFTASLVSDTIARVGEIAAGKAKAAKAPRAAPARKKLKAGVPLGDSLQTSLVAKPGEVEILDLTVSDS